jgi:sugar lactone lactonase YvrE
MNDDAKPQVVLDGLTFPEAPRWREGRLWFSDFFSHRVLILEADGGIETVVEVPRQPSGLGWTPEGRLLVVSMLDHKLLRLDAGGLVEAGDMSAFATGPSNDMVVDAAGRAYVGNFGYDRHHGEAERSAGMVCVDPEGGVTRVADELVFPNGCVITEDGATLIVAETFADRQALRPPIVRRARRRLSRWHLPRRRGRGLVRRSPQQPGEQGVRGRPDRPHHRHRRAWRLCLHAGR